MGFEKIMTTLENLSDNNLPFMNPKKCPVSVENPFKNALCPFYDKCLEMALRQNWSQFSCQFCNFQNDHVKINVDMQDVIGCYRLLARIFKKNL
jgi:hypothetical protein